MANQKAEYHHPEDVQDRLHALGFSHLRARKHGSAVIVESGPTADPLKHFRLRRDTVHLWVLDIANHRGGWERTPYRQQIMELVQLVVDQFPWTIQDVFMNPEGTSEPGN